MGQAELENARKVVLAAREVIRTLGDHRDSASIGRCLEIVGVAIDANRHHELPRVWETWLEACEQDARDDHLSILNR